MNQHWKQVLHWRI